jgi:hypothetical protein
MPKKISQSFGATGSNHKLLLVLLSPSWISSLVVIIASLTVVVGTVIALHFPGSSLQQLVNDQHGTTPPALSTGSLAVNNNFSANTLIDNAPLFVLWGCVGLVVYFFATSLVNGLKEANEFREELGYAHTHRLKLITRAFEKVITRVVILIAWVFFVELTVHTITPYAIALTQYGSGAVGVADNIGYIALAFIIMTACFHAQIVFLRALLLKPRLVGQS